MDALDNADAADKTIIKSFYLAEEVNGIFGQQGWICPKCGRVFSPYTMMCPYCKKEETSNLLNNIPPSGDVPIIKEGI